VPPDPKTLLRDPIMGPHNLRKFQTETIVPQTHAKVSVTTTFPVTRFFSDGIEVKNAQLIYGNNQI
jgi:hypothetical protein